MKTNGAYIPPSWNEKDSQHGELSVKRISELYGLIFHALLRKNFHDGAKQLIETGGVRIRHILVGCAILKESEEDWRTTQLEEERMKQLQKMFTYQALRSIRCMHETDNTSIKKKRNSGENHAEKELGEQIQHAGRLLLNHGCLTDAIKTRNKAFLENKIVKNILKQMWYGKKKLSFSQSHGSGIILAPEAKLYIIPKLFN
ncbi:uncharacterized protein LOC134261510 [Saccostrea cucullata]|uniref:uncharacterized protein LOC134261510 n=1 Tax=Saccostrea cuccullata TaxID=36930 RepID=UPI002ED26C86